MHPQRSLRSDLAALGLLALSIFLGASLLSYDPADPPGELVYPEPAATANMCGRLGAVSADALLSALGLGAYYAVLSLAVLDALLLARRPITQPVIRTFGWLVSLAGLSTLSAMALPELSPGPVIGPGGYLGATGRGLLEMHFATLGAYLVVIALTLGGLLLCTDYVLFRLAAWTIGLPLAGLGKGLAHVGSAYAAKLGQNGQAVAKRAKDDAGGEEDAPKVAVRVAGRGAAADAEPEPGASPSVPEPMAAESKNRAPVAADADSSSTVRVRKPRKNQREELLDEIEAASAKRNNADYELPSLDLLLESEPFCFEEHEKDVRRKAKILEKTFADFGFTVRVVEIQTGPVIAQFEVELEAGLRLSKITALADDLAIALRVPSVRIVAPIPGKNTVGIEVPNAERQLVRLREVMEETNGLAQSLRIPIFLGKDVSGHPMAVDLAAMPHLLIAGRTGTGKSVCLNSIIASVLMTRRPDEVRMLLIDPKMVELSPYKRIPHLMHPVVTDMRKAEAILAWAVEKMEERYALLARAGVRHLSVYNQLGEEELMERVQPENDDERAMIPVEMPYILIVADEMADLMMTAAKEVEGHIIRLAQKSRAVGIHLVMATQKPTVDVITGLIKSNLPARICFEVSSRTDSRVVLDEMGAEKLLGNGDMLFLRPGTAALIRGQGTYLSDDEINRVIEAVATSEPDYITELVQLKTSEPLPEGQQAGHQDELYEPAVDLVIREGRGSVSLLQRALGIGYGRAARLIDFMAEDGVVGPYNGSQAREVLISLEQWQAKLGKAPPADAKPAAPARRRSNKIVLDPEEDDGKESTASLAQARRNRGAAVDHNREGDWAPQDEGEEECEEEAEYPEEGEEAGEEYEEDEGDQVGGEEWEESDEEEEFEDREERDDTLEDGADQDGTHSGPWKAESA